MARQIGSAPHAVFPLLNTAYCTSYPLNALVSCIRNACFTACHAPREHHHLSPFPHRYHTLITNSYEPGCLGSSNTLALPTPPSPPTFGAYEALRTGTLR